MSMSATEKREAAREARKRRILENKNDRMSKVKGEYNQHRAGDSDEDEDSEQLFLIPWSTWNCFQIIAFGFITQKTFLSLSKHYLRKYKKYYF